MNRRRNILIVLALLLAGVAIGVLVWGNLQPSYNWQENYYASNRGPYGTHVIEGLLQDYFPGEEYQQLEGPLREQLPIDSSGGSNYVAIGTTQYLDSADVEHLLEFAASGNRVFLANRDFPFKLMFEVYVEACAGAPWEGYAAMLDSSVKLNLTHPDLNFSKPREYQYPTPDGNEYYEWEYMEAVYFCAAGDGFLPLGTINDDYYNFARLSYGEGLLYIHSTPLAFTNIQLLEEARLAYADRVFSHLREGPIYWDAYTKLPVAARSADDVDRDLSLSQDSPLQYILSQPPLRYAWYTLLLAAFLYLTFRTRRRQRIVPVREQNRNTSLEFVKTIGRLYFLQNDHKRLAEEKMSLFRQEVRRRYQLNLREAPEEMVDELAERAEVSRELISKIFLISRNIRSSSYVSENTLIQFYQQIEAFYQQAR